MTQPGHNSGDEEWRAIPGHEDYEASSKGRIRCARRRRYLKPGDVIAQQVMKSGYLLVSIDGSARLAHRMICAAFHGAAPVGRNEVAHGNGKRDDNRADNLRWATRRENAADIKIHGTENPPRGEMQGRSRLRASDIPNIRRLARSGLRYSDIAGKFGVAPTTISAVANGYTWRHV